ncbi:MAG: hypothetical protein LBL66_09295 [Clostridiales bacterium]|jgi:hypothetical protein|nr:hypothetical protein [Clostridiales bacterium]
MEINIENLTCAIAENFETGGRPVTLTYAPCNRPATQAEARENLVRFLDKINEYAESRNLPPLKYICFNVTEDCAADVYPRIITNFCDCEVLESLWGFGRIIMSPILEAEDLAQYVLCALKDFRGTKVPPLLTSENLTVSQPTTYATKIADLEKRVAALEEEFIKHMVTTACVAGGNDMGKVLVEIKRKLEENM